MIVNGTLFKLYLNDDVDSVKKRIVTRFHPSVEFKYIKFIPPEFTIAENTSITTEDEIQQFLNQKDNFPEDVYNKVFQNRSDVKRQHVETMFILYHHDVVSNLKRDTPLQFMSMVLGQIQNLTSVDAFTVWKNRDKELKLIQTNLDDLKQKVSLFEKEAKEFERIKPSTISDFNQTQNDVNFVFKSVFPITLEMLFDKITVNKNIPFVVMNNEQNFYKLFNNFQPPKEWVELELDRAILLKINITDACSVLPVAKTSTLPTFSNVTFAVEDFIYASISFPIGEKYIDRDTIMSVLFHAIPFLDSQNNNVSLVKEESSLITGYFYIPFLCNAVIWSDLCMTNKFFYNVVVINEIIIPSRIKILFMYVLISKRAKPNTTKQSNDPLGNDTYDTINMISKMPSKGIPECFTRFRIKSQNIETVERYKNIISRLFTIYQNEKQTITQWYKDIVPNFSLNDQVCVIEKDKKLKELVPDLFIATYSRKCLNPPQIISDEQVPEYEKQGKFVMKYPIYGEGKQHNYICTIPNFSNPGLRVNTLVNKNKYPYIPCCYALNQVTKKNSKYNKYMSGRTSLSNKNNVPNAKVLPENIQRFFSLINRDSNKMYILFNISEHRLSLLEAVMTALNLIDEDDFFVGSTIPPSVLRHHEKMTQLVNMAAAKQELYDFSLEDILSLAQTELKPSLFVHLMEQVYNINIFLFSNTHNEKGEMIIPRHTSLYYKPNNNKRTIFLLETGNFCDLIIQTDINKPSNITTVFKYTNPLVQDMWLVFKRLSRSFNVDVIVNVVDSLPNFILENITSQWIDYFGKCRLLQLKNNLMIMVEPTAPFIKPILSSISRTIDGKAVRDFVSKNNISIVEQRINDNNRLRELVCSVDTTTFVILTDLPNTFNRVPIGGKEKHAVIFEQHDPNNSINMFQNNKKIATILSEHALYLFSSWLKDVDSNNMSDQQLFYNFSKQVMIVPNHRYTITPYFSYNNSFINDNVLMVTSEEMKKRIMYSVILNYNSQRTKILSYHTLIRVPHFYQDVVDFEPLENGIIIKGNINHILEPTVTHTTTKNLRPEYPCGRHYFFYNEKFLIDPYKDSTIMFLAINFKQLEQAIQLVKHWNVYGFIDVNNIIQVNDKDDVLIYSYVNEEDINVVHYPQETPIDGVVLGYIFEGVKMWTTLLPLEKTQVKKMYI